MTSRNTESEPHICWALSLSNSLGDKIQTLGSCGCFCPFNNDKNLPTLIAENFRNNGKLCLEGKHEKVFICNSGDILFKDGNDFSEILNVCGNPANINDKLKICLCYGCQKIETCNDIQNVGFLLSGGWFGISFGLLKLL